MRLNISEAIKYPFSIPFFKDYVIGLLIGFLIISLIDTFSNSGSSSFLQLFQAGFCVLLFRFYLGLIDIDVYNTKDKENTKKINKQISNQIITYGLSFIVPSIFIGIIVVLLLGFLSWGVFHINFFALIEKSLFVAMILFFSMEIIFTPLVIASFTSFAMEPKFGNFFNIKRIFLFFKNFPLEITVLTIIQAIIYILLLVSLLLSDILSCVIVVLNAYYGIVVTMLLAQLCKNKNIYPAEQDIPTENI